MRNGCGDFHVDISGKIARLEDIGIACMNPITKVNCGCAIRGKVVRKLKKEFFRDKGIHDRAKFYGILIYLILRGYEFKFDRLIICNDENFSVVKKVIVFLMGGDFNSDKIIGISEFRKPFGRKIGSPADNLARCYRKRGFSSLKRNYGKDINVVEITYGDIKKCWGKCSEATFPTESRANAGQIHKYPSTESIH